MFIRGMVLAAVIVCCLAAQGAARAETLLERGTYLVRGIVACGNCHTPKDAEGRPIADREFAGGFVIETPAFRTVTPNITPDPGTGIGTWSDEEIIRAIRDGRHANGRMLRPPMPYEEYRKMSDRDVRAIVAYLRKVKPISSKNQPSVYRIPIPATYGPTVSGVPTPPASDKIAYGRYLAEIGHCMECHTPRVGGQMLREKLGAGGFEVPAPTGGTIVTSNLTPANRDGIAGWSDPQVAHAIRFGERPDGGKLVPLMAFDWYRTINDRDMAALIAYLRSLPPATP